MCRSRAGGEVPVRFPMPREGVASLLMGWESQGSRRTRREGEAVRSEHPGKRGCHEQSCHAAGVGFERSKRPRLVSPSGCHVVCHAGQSFDAAPRSPACWACCVKCPSDPSPVFLQVLSKHATTRPLPCTISGAPACPGRRLSCPRTLSAPREPHLLHLGCSAWRGVSEQGLWHETKLEPQTCRFGAVAGELCARLL